MTDNATAITISVERVMEMSEREVYDLADHYVKGRFYRFAVDPETQNILEQRESAPEDRDSRYEELFEAFRIKLYNVLYSPQVLPRYRLALQQTVRAVEHQLEEYSDNKTWQRAARGFLSLVQDELARAEVVLAQQEEESARHHLDTLLATIAAHRLTEDADEAEEADEALYMLADQISAQIAPESSTEGSQDLLSA